VLEIEARPSKTNDREDDIRKMKQVVSDLPKLVYESKFVPSWVTKENMGETTKLMRGAMKFRYKGDHNDISLMNTKERVQGLSGAQMMGSEEYLISDKGQGSQTNQTNKNQLICLVKCINLNTHITHGSLKAGQVVVKKPSMEETGPQTQNRKAEERVVEMEVNGKVESIASSSDQRNLRALENKDPINSQDHENQELGGGGDMLDQSNQHDDAQHDGCKTVEEQGEMTHQAVLEELHHDERAQEHAEGMKDIKVGFNAMEGRKVIVTEKQMVPEIRCSKRFQQ
jgi:hypothetical protein